jgi:hypothetical protein
MDCCVEHLWYLTDFKQQVNIYFYYKQHSQ